MLVQEKNIWICWAFLQLLLKKTHDSIIILSWLNSTISAGYKLTSFWYSLVKLRLYIKGKEHQQHCYFQVNKSENILLFNILSPADLYWETLCLQQLWEHSWVEEIGFIDRLWQFAQAGWLDNVLLYSCWQGMCQQDHTHL